MGNCQEKSNQVFRGHARAYTLRLKGRLRCPRTSQELRFRYSIGIGPIAIRNPVPQKSRIAHTSTAAQSTEIIAYWRICNFSRTVLLRLSWSCTEILTHSVTSQFARPRIARHTSDRSLLRFAHHAPLLSVPRCYLPPTPPSTGGGTRSLRTTQHSHGIVDLQPMPPPLEFHTP